MPRIPKFSAKLGANYRRVQVPSLTSKSPPSFLSSLFLFPIPPSFPRSGRPGWVGAKVLSAVPSPPPTLIFPLFLSVPPKLALNFPLLWQLIKAWCCHNYQHLFILSGCPTHFLEVVGQPDYLSPPCLLPLANDGE